MDQTRRQLLRASLFGALASVAGTTVSGCGGGARGDAPNIQPPPLTIPPRTMFGPLLDPDANGVRIPDGFQVRIVARSGQTPISGSGFNWHAAPDGGASFSTNDGGWIYVSNSEVGGTGGGAGALRFDAAGQVIDAYQILSGTNRNCAGGATPWNTWLSCEEFDQGRVWECDPFGGAIAQRLPSLGSFRHEAAAIDPATDYVYLTEDKADGGLYRFIPAGTKPNGDPELATGTLQIAQVTGGIEGTVIWHDVPDPDAAVVETRFQVAESASFNRGEGIWYDSEMIYFATTGDNRIWALALRSNEVTILYDDAFYADPVLKGVDNVTVSPRGDIIVAEDGDDMQLVAITPGGDIEPVIQIVGHSGSEITGPAFDPSGTRLYFSSQRGSSNLSSDGVTYELSGPFPV